MRHVHTKRVRPTTRQSPERTQHSPKADQAHSSTRDEREEWCSPFPLSYGMTKKQMLRTLAFCFVAVAVGFLLLYLFGWAIGHFQKGWW